MLNFIFKRQNKKCINKALNPPRSTRGGPGDKAITKVQIKTQQIRKKRKIKNKNTRAS